MIQLTCPNCKKTFKTKSENIGKSGKCPQCASTITIPDHPPSGDTNNTESNEKLEALKTVISMIEDHEQNSQNSGMKKFVMLFKIMAIGLPLIMTFFAYCSIEDQRPEREYLPYFCGSLLAAPFIWGFGLALDMLSRIETRLNPKDKPK